MRIRSVRQKKLWKRFQKKLEKQRPTLIGLNDLDDQVGRGEVIMMAIDPVCKMVVNEKEAAATYEYKGKIYYFCAVECKENFAKNPEKFLKKDKE